MAQQLIHTEPISPISNQNNFPLSKQLCKKNLKLTIMMIFIIVLVFGFYLVSKYLIKQQSNIPLQTSYIPTSGNNSLYLIKELTIIPSKYSTIVKISDYKISDYGDLAAIKIKEGTKEFYLINGVEGQEYDNIEEIVFNSEGDRYAYKARKGNKSIFVLDGKEIGVEFDKIIYGKFSVEGNSFIIRGVIGNKEYLLDTKTNQKTETSHYTPKHLYLNIPPSVSPDGKRIAYLEEAVHSREKYYVIDGIEGKHYQERFSVEPGIIFSPNSKNYAYRIDTYIFQYNSSGILVDSKKDKTFMVVDGKEQKMYDSIDGVPVFSPDGSKCAYVAKLGNKNFLVINNQELNGYTKVTSPNFSSDGSIFIYFTSQEEKQNILCKSKDCTYNKWFYFVNNKQGEQSGAPYSEVAFSPDGHNYAFVLNKGYLNASIVVNGRESKKYVQAEEPIYSPDGTKLAYTAYEEKGIESLMINNTAVEKHHSIDTTLSNVAFSPDSKHYAILAQDNLFNESLYIDGKKGKYEFREYGDLTARPYSLKFTPDSKRVTYRVINKKDEEFLVTEFVQ